MEEQKRNSQGLWLNKKGQDTILNLACPACKKKLVGFSNKFKETDKQPDYNVLVSREQ